MTTDTNALAINETTEMIADFAGGSSGDVSMMIGVGVVKESDAVFFQYLGDQTEPAALMLPKGRPLTYMNNVTLTGISIAEDIGEFKATKLNIYLTTSQGRVTLITSGLNTIWSQCIINGLMGLFNEGMIYTPFKLETWKGNSKMKPCFGAIKVRGARVSDQMMYDQLTEARTDGNKAKVTAIMRDAVEILSTAVKVEATKVETEEVNEETF